jgi:hypothetical protein
MRGQLMLHGQVPLGYVRGLQLIFAKQVWRIGVAKGIAGKTVCQGAQSGDRAIADGSIGREAAWRHKVLRCEVRGIEARAWIAIGAALFSVEEQARCGSCHPALRELVCQSQPRGEIGVDGWNQTLRGCSVHCQQTCKRGSECNVAGRWNVELAGNWIEVGLRVMALQDCGEEVVADTGIDRQARCSAPIVLQEYTKTLRL